MAPHSDFPNSQPAPRGVRLLLVDDDAIVLRTVVRILRARRPEWSITTATTAFQAADFLKVGGFDLLVTDLDMPGLSGIDLLQYVGAHHPGLVSVVHSARVGEMGGPQLERLCWAILRKPVTPAELLSTLDAALEFASRASAAGHRPSHTGDVS